MQRIGFVISEGFQIMGLAAQAVFEFANVVSGKSVYELQVLSEKGGPVYSSMGMVIQTEAFNDEIYDTLIINGSSDPSQKTSPALIGFIRNGLEKSRRLASICTGAFLLAEAGVLDGRSATTHWYYARELQARYPKVKMAEDRIFINDGSVWTSAGMTAGFDMALALVENDLGADIARSLAQKLVMYHRRAGGQSQHSELLELAPKSDRIQNALAYAKKNLHTALSVEQLAAAVNLSPRQFSRVFRTETGQSPAKAIENLRLEVARLMVEQSHHSFDVVARETGFIDIRRMRESFLRAFGQPPQVIRRNARLQEI